MSISTRNTNVPMSTQTTAAPAKNISHSRFNSFTQHPRMQHYAGDSIRSRSNIARPSQARNELFNTDNAYNDTFENNSDFNQYMYEQQLLSFYQQNSQNLNDLENSSLDDETVQNENSTENQNFPLVDPTENST